MPSLCFSFLIILCSIQFILISRIVFLHNRNKSSVEELLDVYSNVNEMDISSSNINILQSPLDSIVLHDTAVINDRIQSNSTLDGVAVTLMLHSPAWYQRRYTMMIQNILNNLPSDKWKIQIFYTGKGQSKAGLDMNPAIQRYIDQGRVILTVLPPHLEKTKKYQLMVNPWLWENMLADKVLIFGGGSVICSNSPYTINDFLKYDYIGSPWRFSYKKAFKDVGGDGGISIRNRQHILKALEYQLSKITDSEEREKAADTWGQEDHFYVKTLLEMKENNLIDSNIAPKEATLLFSAIDNYSNETVWSASGTLPAVEFDVRDKFLSYCPELKLVYPSLHDPNCFGADPNGPECAKSICALKVPRRKGGC